jgi:hypothetical protein
MHTATSATALAVLKEGSARSARRPLERELSTVADGLVNGSIERPPNVWQGALTAPCHSHQPAMPALCRHLDSPQVLQPRQRHL